jgi:Ca2+-binding RTX toxin-like protein
MAGGAGDDIMYSYGGADWFIYGAVGFGADQISGFSRADGAKIYLVGWGFTFEALSAGFSYGGGNGQITIGADSILVFGVTQFLESDFML